MTTVAKKLQLGTAALAVAASAALIAPMVAVADESDSGSDSVGSSAAKTPKRENRGAKKPATNPSDSAPVESPADAPEDIPSVPTADTSADATGDRPLIQNSLIWFGKPNPVPPTPQTEIYTFTPLVDLPGFSQPMFGWMDGFDFEACVLGLSSTTTGMIGPYGTSTTQFSGQGC